MLHMLVLNQVAHGKAYLAVTIQEVIQPCSYFNKLHALSSIKVAYNRHN